MAPSNNTNNSRLEFDWSNLTSNQPGTPHTVEKITPNHSDPDYYDGKYQSPIDENLHLSSLPTVIVLVSDTVKLIRNNSVPMLQV